MNNTTTFQPGPLCHKWMKPVLNSQNVTLEIINDQLIRQFYGGIWFLAVSIAVGMIGNIHVAYVYFRKFKPSNYRLFVLWLSILDLVNVGVSAPLIIFYLLHPVTYPFVCLCKLTRFILYFLPIASTSAMLVIAIERYLKVMNPYGRQITTKEAKLMCAVSVFVAILLSWPAPILYGLSHVDTEIGEQGIRCLTEDRFKNTQYMTIMHIIQMIYFLGISVTLGGIYISLAKRLWRSNDFKRKTSLNLNGDLGERPDYCLGKCIYTTVTLFAVTLAYILCALPHHCLAIFYFVSKNLECRLSLLESQLFYAFVWSYFMNSTINPFIYAFRDKNFKEECKIMYIRVFCCLTNRELPAISGRSSVRSRSLR